MSIVTRPQRVVSAAPEGTGEQCVAVEFYAYWVDMAKKAEVRFQYEPVKGVMSGLQVAAPSTGGNGEPNTLVTRKKF